MRNKMKKPSWVFWLNISIRKHWFSKWWKSRGANSIDIQVWIFHINIGLPWHKNVLRYELEMFGNYDNLEKTNRINKLKKLQ